MIFGKWQTYFCNRCDDEFIVTGQWEEPHCPNCGEDDQIQLAATNERVPVSDLPSVMAEVVEKYFETKQNVRKIEIMSQPIEKDIVNIYLNNKWELISYEDYKSFFTHIIAEAPGEKGEKT